MTDMLRIVDADLGVTEHAAAFLRLLDEYARDPMGGGAGLSAYARLNLVDTLRKRNGVYIVLGFVDTEPVGLANCMEGFSTFACKPLLNIHDFVVRAPYRGRGIAAAMLGHIEALALRLGCCKLTLEVLEGNQAAQKVYRRFGFEGYELDPQAGKALFWEKKIV